jgi:hypothetical protein
MIVEGFKGALTRLGSMGVAKLDFIARFKAVSPFHRDCRSLLILGRAVSS